jgi:hypothetical protein
MFPGNASVRNVAPALRIGAQARRTAYVYYFDRAAT